MKYISLSEQSYFILLSLVSNPLHGYGIIKKVEEISNQRVVLAAGTLYGAIEKLKKENLIMQEKTEVDSRRKNYALTEQGKQILMDEFLTLQQRYTASKNILMKGGLLHGD